MKITLSATVYFFLIALCCGTALAQEVSTYEGTITTTFNNQAIPAQDTKVIIGGRLEDMSGASNPSCGGSLSHESNRFNLKVETPVSNPTDPFVSILTRPGEIQIKSAAPQVGSTSGTVLQYWCICDFTNRANCGACYPDETETLPQPTPFPLDAIRGCLLDTHETATNPPNLLAVPISGGFFTPMVIQKSATLTGTIYDPKTTPRLELSIKGTTVGGSFTSEIKAKLK